jgi:hypothetical protein
MDPTSEAEKKRLKSEAKREKKRVKADVKAGAASPAASTSPSAAVRYAEGVRGILYLVLGGSLVTALVLGQRGGILSLDDIIDNLFAARAGKVVLALIALALVIYGLKHLRLVR